MLDATDRPHDGASAKYAARVWIKMDPNAGDYRVGLFDALTAHEAQVWEAVRAGEAVVVWCADVNNT